MKTYNGAYLMGNFPTPDLFVQAGIRALDFFDFLEIGIPFSDPVADGPVITGAAQSMIQQGVTFEQILKSMEQIRQKVSANKHIYIMTYANHVFHYGIERHAKLCEEKKINGVILPDVPFEESDRFKQCYSAYGRDYIHFVTPENTRTQIEQIAASARGFLYAISIRGITGTDLTLDMETIDRIALARSISPAPVVLGFGIKSLASARIALQHADGFIMGTRMIELLSTHFNEFDVFIKSLETGLSG